MIDVASSGGIAPAGRAVAGKTGTVQHPTLNGQNKDAWMVGYTPSVSTAVWVGTDTSDPIKNAAGRPVFGRMLPGSIWQNYMNSAVRGTPSEQFSRFVALGTPLGAGDPAGSAAPSTSSESKSDDDSDSDSSDDSDSKKSKDKKSDKKSDSSDKKSDGSSDSKSRNSDSSGSDSSDSSDG
jgi:membrane peptidoglycan carboxypeptidase